MSQEGLEKKIAKLLNYYKGSAYLLGQEHGGGTLRYYWLPYVVVYSGITNYKSIKKNSDRNFSMGISPPLYTAFWTTGLMLNCIWLFSTSTLWNDTTLNLI